MHSFFNEDHIDEGFDSKDHIRQLRSNFAAYLEHRLPWASVTFSPRQVILHANNPATYLPVLLVDQSFGTARNNGARHEHLMDGSSINRLLCGKSGNAFASVQDWNSCSSVPGTFDTISLTNTSTSHDGDSSMTLSSADSCSPEQASNVLDWFEWLTRLPDIDPGYERRTKTKKRNLSQVNVDDFNATWLASLFLCNNGQD